MGIAVAGAGERGWAVVAVAVVIVLVACGLGLPAVAAAESFEVNSAADEPDLAVGTGGCASAAGVCTLRAAIEEADAVVGESSHITFEEEGLFEAGPGSTIALGSGLPPITVALVINGHECPTALGIQGPCVTVEGPASGTALRVEAEGVEIAGLAVTGAEVGIDVTGARSFTASRDWFGVSALGDFAGDGTGIVVGPGSDGSKIGTQGLGEGNVFADGSGDALEILGADGVKVLSNYFGVSPDGATPAPNGGADIAVASTPGHEAAGTAIGMSLSATALGTPGCDRGCNVISGAGTSGIDLTGAAGTGPPTATTIAGNFIGLDAVGTGAVANTDAGVLVGGAPATVIGGLRASEANYISGGEGGVRAGPAAPDLVVRGNGIGIGPDGAPSSAPPTAGIAVDSGTLPSAAFEATIADNRLRVGAGVGISQEGFGAAITGNSVAGGETGIETLGEDVHGNLIEGNSVTGTAASGIVAANELNEILGNDVSSAGAPGILIDGSHAGPAVEGNRIGGDAAADENAITGSAGAAIEILDRATTANEVACNHGSLNAGPFIELVKSPPGESKGPNYGIQPPAFATATETGASGSGAEPGALVRVFRKQLPEAGELRSFLGEARADASGRWEVGYAEAIPGGTPVAATQTSEAATSELALATTSGSGAGTGSGGEVGAGGGAGASGGTGNSGGDAGAGTGSSSGGAAPTKRPRKPGPKAKAPQTWVLLGTREGSRRRGVRFAFDSDQLGSRFECRIDRGPFRPCRSPQRFTHVRRGRNVFEVRAVGRSGRVDPTPAKWRFTIR